MAPGKQQGSSHLEKVGLTGRYIGVKRPRKACAVALLASVAMFGCLSGYALPIPDSEGGVGNSWSVNWYTVAPSNVVNLWTDADGGFEAPQGLASGWLYALSTDASWLHLWKPTANSASQMNFQLWFEGDLSLPSAVHVDEQHLLHNWDTDATSIVYQGDWYTTSLHAPTNGNNWAQGAYGTGGGLNTPVLAVPAVPEPASMALLGYGHRRPGGFANAQEAVLIS